MKSSNKPRSEIFKKCLTADQPNTTFACFFKKERKTKTSRQRPDNQNAATVKPPQLNWGKPEDGDLQVEGGERRRNPGK
jgi:hypothetical protein